MNLSYLKLSFLIPFRLLSIVNARGYPCPPFKIIILDEADSMTEDAQVCVNCMHCTFPLCVPLALLCFNEQRIVNIL